MSTESRRRDDDSASPGRASMADRSWLGEPKDYDLGIINEAKVRYKKIATSVGL